MKKMILFSLCLGLILGSAMVSSAQDKAPGKVHDSGKVFERMDANNDGKVTKDEFMADSKARAEKRWSKLDPQNKGALTKAEMNAALKAKAKKMPVTK